MEILPARNSIPGVGLYYLNTVAFLAFSTFAWKDHDNLAILLAIITLFTLLLQDILWFRQGNFDPHDKYLIEKLKRRFDDEKTRELLTDFDFSNYTYHTIHHLIKLEEIINKWAGVDFEFKDKRCDRIWIELRQHISTLLGILEHGQIQNAYNYSLAYTAKSGHEGENYAEMAQQQTHEIWRLYQQLRKIYIQKMTYE